jgi:hypothetical protein
MMFELYVRCPTTGEPVYAGFPSTADGATPGFLMKNAVCPACGAAHDWHNAPVWSAIPVTMPPSEVPSFHATTVETVETWVDEPEFRDVA